MLRFSLSCVLLLAACGDDDAPTDAGAGVDATVVDAGSVDAGTREDAGAVDAGAVEDAGLPEDAGPVDAGPPLNPVEAAGEVEMVASGFEGEGFGFLEGPHWRGDALVFSDLIFADAGRQTIYALDPADDSLSIVLRPSMGANGSATNGAGDHVTCLQAGRRLARVDEGSLVTLFERYEGARLNAPNDLVFSASGRWYFTDPGYGVDPGDREIDAHGVYLVDGDALTRVWTGTTTQRPNGIGLSPDDAVLYVADTNDGVVRAFDVQGNGSLGEERTFADETGGADGLTVDEAGNVYVTTGTGVQVFAPDGTRWGTIGIPMQPANCAFGDDDRRTLYVTARTTLYRVRMPIAGIEGR